MPNCPKCSADIKHLKHVETGVSEVYNFYLGTLGFPAYDFEEDFCDDADGSYECPKCASEICVKEEDAVAFLKGESIDRPLP